MISDHLPQFVIISDFKFDYTKMSHLFNDYSQFYVNKLLIDYLNIDLSLLIENHIGLNEKFSQFLHNFHILVNHHCPQNKYAGRD